LNPFLTNDFEAAVCDSDYKLRSIVHHHGSRPSSGHYTADVVRFLKMPPVSVGDVESASTVGEEKESWVTFDDGSSCVTSIERVISDKQRQSTAYMLMYVLNDEQ